LSVLNRRPDTLVHILNLCMNGDEPYSKLMLYSDAEEHAIHFDRCGVLHWNARLPKLPGDSCWKPLTEFGQCYFVPVFPDAHDREAPQAETQVCRALL
jgi:hypothetical protein